MKFDVFVSFRGIDTRRTFVSHLLLSLSKEGFMSFKSEEETPENEPASSQVIQAIQESKIAIVVISRNYTASVSCLDELAMIMECEEKQSLVVLPVLYEVDSSHVLSQADNLLSSNGNNKISKKVKKRWRDALAKSVEIYSSVTFQWDDEDSDASIIDRAVDYVSFSLDTSVILCSAATQEFICDPYDGWEDMYENAFAENDCTLTCRNSVTMPFSNSGLVTRGIEFVRAAFGAIAGKFMMGKKLGNVKPRPAWSLVDAQEENNDIGNELSRLFLPNDCSSFVGMERHTKAVTTMLDLHVKDRVGEIGIWGVRGVGKTTLCKCVYEQISPHFQDHYFMKDVKNYSRGNYSTCLLEEITRAALMPTRESESLREIVKAKLGHRKVLLIVDDMFHIGQLKNIIKFSRWFGPGSRLIMVSQNKELLLQCEIKRLYEVESLRYDEALQLFSQFAFKHKHAPTGFDELSVRAVLITCRIPLALKVFGSFLCGKCINEWESELCRLEASQDRCVAEVSSYIGNAFS